MEFMKSLEGKDIVTLIGILLTFSVGLVTLTQSLKRIKLDNLTQHRVEWINTLRKYVADYVSEIDLFKVQVNIVEDTQIMNYREKLANKGTLIRLHLNFKGTLDKRIIKNIDEITNNMFLAHYIKKLGRMIQMNRNSATNPLLFKSYIHSNPDRLLVNFLRDYSVQNNVNTKLNSFNSGEQSDDYLEIVIRDYTSVFNSKSYIDEFLTNLNDIHNDLFRRVTNNRNDLTKLVQIYLKAEWTRVKKEISFISFYNEEKTLRQLEEEWNRFNGATQEGSNSA